MARDGGHETATRRSVRYGDRAIEVELSYGRREQLRISVHPDLRVTVKAPEGRSEAEVLQRVQRRARWIVRQLDRFEEFKPLPPAKRYVSGETFRYLGRQYRLRVLAETPESVKLVGGFLWVRTPDRNARDRIAALVERWYRRHARVVFARKLGEIERAGRPFGLPVARGWRVQKLETRWGSCGRSGRILLNLDLVQAPLSCIEYVIAHELCHLVELNHTRAFYRLLGQVMPDWKRRKAKLDEVVL